MFGLPLTEITAADLKDDDWVAFSRDVSVLLRAMEVRSGSSWVTVRWAHQGERCQLRAGRVLYRVEVGARA